MPGAPATGGWGGSNRTLGIVVEGFTEEEVGVPVFRCCRRVLGRARGGVVALTDLARTRADRKGRRPLRQRQDQDDQVPQQAQGQGARPPAPRATAAAHAFARGAR